MPQSQEQVSAPVGNLTSQQQHAPAPAQAAPFQGPSLAGALASVLGDQNFLQRATNQDFLQVNPNLNATSLQRSGVGASANILDAAARQLAGGNNQPQLVNQPLIHQLVNRSQEQQQLQAPNNQVFSQAVIRQLVNSIHEQQQQQQQQRQQQIEQQRLNQQQQLEALRIQQFLSAAAGPAAVSQTPAPAQLSQTLDALFPQHQQNAVAAALLSNPLLSAAASSSSQNQPSNVSQLQGLLGTGMSSTGQLPWQAQARTVNDPTVGVLQQLQQQQQQQQQYLPQAQPLAGLPPFSLSQLQGTAMSGQQEEEKTQQAFARKPATSSTGAQRSSSSEDTSPDGTAPVADDRKRPADGSQHHGDQKDDRKKRE